MPGAVPCRARNAHLVSFGRYPSAPRYCAYAWPACSRRRASRGSRASRIAGACGSVAENRTPQPAWSRRRGSTPSYPQRRAARLLPVLRVGQLGCAQPPLPGQLDRLALAERRNQVGTGRRVDAVEEDPTRRSWRAAGRAGLDASPGTELRARALVHPTSSLTNSSHSRRVRFRPASVHRSSKRPARFGVARHTLPAPPVRMARPSGVKARAPMAPSLTRLSRTHVSRRPMSSG